MSAMKSFSPLRFKADFPLFQQASNRDLIYLDNAATTQKPQVVLEAMQHFYLTANGNAHRASHRLARQATEQIESTRELAANFLHAKHEEIVFCRGATEGINLIAYGLADRVQAQDEIIVSAAEHHANFLPWQRLANQKKAQLKILPLRGGAPDLSVLNGLITERTKIIALTAASNVLGAKTDLTSLCISTNESKPILVLDAAQRLPHDSINVQKVPCDFLVCSGHKMFAPNGIGLVYGREAVLKDLPPWQLGGEMVDHVSWLAAEYAKPPRCFEAGTLPMGDIVGLKAALEFLSSQDRQAMQAHEHGLIERLHKGLFDLPELECLTQITNNLGIATCVLRDSKQERHLSDLALWFDEHNIAVRVGQQCAQPLYQTIGQPTGGLRFSVAPYNLVSDIDTTLNVLSDWLTMTRPKPRALHCKQQTEHNTNGLLASADDLSPFSLELLAAQLNWQSRYRLLMAWGQSIQLKTALRQAEHRVSACETQTWLAHWQEGEAHYFVMDSESKIVRGLGALLLLWFHGKTTQEITEFDWRQSAEVLGLERHLTASRRNGFFALIEQIHKHVNG